MARVGLLLRRYCELSGCEDETVSLMGLRAIGAKNSWVENMGYNGTHTPPGTVPLAVRGVSIVSDDPVCEAGGSLFHGSFGR